MYGTVSHGIIIDTAASGIIATDAEGRIILINRQARKILDCLPENAEDRPVCDLLPITGREVMACIESGTPSRGQHVVGANVSLVADITPIMAMGSVAGAVVCFQEMGQFDRAAQKLDSYKRLNRELSAIFDASSDGIWVCDGKGKILNCNRASEKLNGIRASQVIGRDVADAVKGGLFDRSVTLEVLETRRQVSMVQQIPRTNRFLLTTATPTFDEEGNILFVVTNERDMTQLNRIRSELEQSRMETEKIRDELAELSSREKEGGAVVAESAAMRKAVKTVRKLARIEPSHILVAGDPGSGKGTMARLIHRSSNRDGKPFLSVNCSALSESLLEAELFGYEKGAFAANRNKGKAGLFELAHGGTLFLAEIEDLPLTLQAKLLRYFEEGEVVRMGGTRTRKVDCLLVAATNIDLKKRIKEKGFRQDFFYRLSAFSINIPPLRNRPEDIFELAGVFLAKYNREYGMEKRISAETLSLLATYPFPGNVRELKNIIKRAVVMAEGTLLDGNILSSLENGVVGWRRQEPSENGGLAEELLAHEAEILKNAMARCRSTREMAAFLKVSQPTVVRKMQKHGLTRRDRD